MKINVFIFSVLTLLSSLVMAQTDVATARVTSVVARIIAENPNITVAQVKGSLAIINQDRAMVCAGFSGNDYVPAVAALAATMMAEVQGLTAANVASIIKISVKNPALCGQ